LIEAKCRAIVAHLGDRAMEIFIFARFHAREGQENAVMKALHEQVAATRTEPGCLKIDAFRAATDPRQFFIHARWHDEAAFNVHAELPSTQAFVTRMEALIDHPFDATRAHAIT
jgi:quinol monooxygenase YgiN